MIKKIFLGTLLVGLLGILIVGAIMRTNAKTADGAAGETGRQGRAAAQSLAADSANDGQRGGRGGSGRTVDGQNTPGAAPAPQADVMPQGWLGVTGTVTSVADDLVEIQTTAGTVIPFEGQPLSYAIGQGFSLAVGNAVSVRGFVEDGEFRIGGITNLDTGANVTLRDATGRPGWSGRGRRS